MKTQNTPMHVRVSIYKQHKGIEELRIYDPVYRDTLQVFLGDFDRFLDFVDPKDHPLLKNVNKGANAFHVIDGECSLVYLSKDNVGISVVVHELIHVCFSHFQKRVLEPSWGSAECQEFFAYKTEFYIEEILKSRLSRHL